MSRIQAAVKSSLSSSRTALNTVPLAPLPRAGPFDNSGQIRAQGVLNSLCDSGSVAAVPALGTLRTGTETAMNTCPLCNEVCEGSKATIFNLPAHRACINGYGLRRGVAFLIDRIVLAMGAGIIFVVLGRANGNLAVLLSVVVLVLWVIRDSFSGRFLGKAIMGLRVAGNMEGQPPTLAQSLDRNLTLCIPGASIVAAFQISHGRRIGEKGAGTWVIPHAQQHSFFKTLASASPGSPRQDTMEQSVSLSRVRPDDSRPKLEPALMAALAAKGAGILEFGVREYEPWSARLLANLGEGIADKAQANLPQIYAASCEELRLRQSKLHPAPQLCPVAAARPQEEPPGRIRCRTTSSSEQRTARTKPGLAQSWAFASLGGAACVLVLGLLAALACQDEGRPSDVARVRSLPPSAEGTGRSLTDAETSAPGKAQVDARTDEICAYSQAKEHYDRARTNAAALALLEQYGGKALQQLKGQTEAGVNTASTREGTQAYLDAARSWSVAHGEAECAAKVAADEGNVFAAILLTAVYGDRGDLVEIARWKNLRDRLLKDYRPEWEKTYATEFQRALTLAGESVPFYATMVARLYQYGVGVQKNALQAVKWYRKAADQGYGIAQTNLGLCYMKGQGVQQDYTEAVKWFRKAAAQGHASAQCLLATSYTTGHGVEQDYSEAVNWYRKAAEQGSARAQGGLGYCYTLGRGVPQDSVEAVKWYRRAAEQNDAVAQFNLGLSFVKGFGVPQDYAEADKWFNLALAQAKPADFIKCNGGGAGSGVPFVILNGTSIGPGESALVKTALGSIKVKCLSLEGGTAKVKIEGEDQPRTFKLDSRPAALNPFQAALSARTTLEKRMTSAQLVEGQRRTLLFTAKKEAGGEG